MSLWWVKIYLLIMNMSFDDCILCHSMMYIMSSVNSNESLYLNFLSWTGTLSTIRCKNWAIGGTSFFLSWTFLPQIYSMHLDNIQKLFKFILK